MVKIKLKSIAGYPTLLPLHPCSTCKRTNLLTNGPVDNYVYCEFGGLQ